MIDKTIELIKKLHGGQFDHAGLPYWMHPVEVMKNLLPDASEEDKVIALLHDVGEDCSGKDWKVAWQLVTDYDAYIQRGVMLLTRINGFFLHHATMLPTQGSYLDYIKNIVASRHYGAIITKDSDNRQNSNPERIASVPDEEQRKRLTEMATSRYARARDVIQDELKHWNGRTRS